MDYTDDYTGNVAFYNNIRTWNYGPAGFDRRHSVAVNWLWNIPGGSHLWHSPIAKTLFDNWQLSGIVSYIRGAPQGIILDTGGVDLTGGTDEPRALITGNAVLPHGQRNVLQYFNTGAVSLPPINTVGSNGQYSNFVGNAGKVVFRGPGTDNYNVSLFKNIIIKERVTLQLRGEFYNLFNHPSFSSVDNTAVFTTEGLQTNGTFGEINGDNFGPRQVQLAGRISF